MTKFFIYLVFIAVLLVDFTPQVKSQTKTTNADTTVTSFDPVSSTAVPEISTELKDSNTAETTNTTEKINSTTITENNIPWRGGPILPGPILPRPILPEPGECDCNEHLGYICGCGELCPWPREFGIGPECPQYCVDTLTCVCNEGYRRDVETNLCVPCNEYFYK